MSRAGPLRASLRGRVGREERAEARLEEAVARIRATGADVLLATPTDPRGAGLFSALRTRHAVRPIQRQRNGQLHRRR